MATLQTSKVASTVQARGGTDITAVYATYELGAALALNDVIEMVKVPAGATILDIILHTTDLDTGGSPTITLDVGDGADPDRFMDGLIIGRTGGRAIVDQAGLLHKYTAEDTIDVLVQAGPATGATSGSIKMVVYYTMQQ